MQGVVDAYDFLVTPTVSAMPVDNADDGDTVGPARSRACQVERLIGWCMTYFLNFSGHPAASIPAGMVDGRLPVGMQIIGGRYDRRGRADGEPSVRAAPPLGPHVRALPWTLSFPGRLG